MTSDSSSSPHVLTVSTHLSELSTQYEAEHLWSHLWNRIRKESSNTELWEEMFSGYLTDSASVSLWKIYISYIK
jgi:hypothetical protein